MRKDPKHELLRPALDRFLCKRRTLRYKGTGLNLLNIAIIKKQLQNIKIKQNNYMSKNLYKLFTDSSRKRQSGRPLMSHQNGRKETEKVIIDR